MDDRMLLHEFVAEGSEQAFAELVRRHIDLVYSAARRQAKDAAEAEEITQTVFIRLAARAGAIRDAASLPGWLLVTTRTAAVDHLRAAARRRHHEQQAAAMKHESSPESEPAWQAVRPILDEAVANLKAADRDAITLRFFKGQRLCDVAATLGVSEPTAQRRVSRAVDRLRRYFARRGITASSDALASLLGANAILPAPAELTAQITAAALSGGASAAVSVNALKGMGFIMATTKTKLTIAAGLALLAAGVATPIAYRAASRPEAPAPQVAPVADWKPRFNAIYGLAPAQNVKRVVPPFIPERANAYAAQGVPPSKQDIRDVAALIFESDGQETAWQAAWYDPIDLGDVLTAVAGIRSQDCDLPRELFRETVSGDWVVRGDATQAQKAIDLSWALRDLLGHDKVLRQEPMEREAIVVTGRLQFDESLNEGAFPVVHLFSGDARPQTAFNVFIGQTAHEWLQIVGEVTGRPMVVEAEIPQDGPAAVAMYENHRFLRSIGVAPPELVDVILANLSRQTGLQFKRERRTVPTWRLVEVAQ